MIIECAALTSESIEQKSNKIITSKCISVTALIYSYTLIIEDFNNLHMPKDRLSKQKLNRKMLTLNGIINQMNIRNIHKTFYQTINIIISQ